MRQVFQEVVIFMQKRKQKTVQLSSSTTFWSMVYRDMDSLAEDGIFIKSAWCYGADCSMNKRPMLGIRLFHKRDDRLHVDYYQS